MILVPMNTPGVKRAAHTAACSATITRRTATPKSISSNVRVPAENLLLGEGRGFEIAQGRLGPGRIHHCMRTIGVAERALEMMCKRAQARVAFGKRLSEQGVTLERIAESRIMIDQARWLVLNAAYMMDTVGNRAAKAEIAMIKVAAPNMTCKVIDWAIQVHGGGGVSDDFPLAAPMGRRAHAAFRGRSGRSASRADRQAGAVALSAEGRRRASAQQARETWARAFQILAEPCDA